MVAAYGRPHMRSKQAALDAMRQGQPCPGCGHPMWRGQKLDYDHVIPLVLGGRPDGLRRLMHAGCNRRLGAILGNRLRAHRPRKPRPRW